MSDDAGFAHLDLTDVWSREPDLPDFVLPGLAIGTVGNIVAPGGLGKSFLMLATALSVAVGGDIGGVWGKPAKQGKCAFLSLEDPEVELRVRLHALAEELSEDQKQIAPDYLRVLPAAGKGFTLASQVGVRGEPQRSDRFEKFKDYLLAFQPRLLIVDTLNRAIGGLSENDAGTMGWMLSQLEALALDANCAIVLCHHVSKGAITSGAGSSAHAARGSSVITDNARWQVNLSAPGDDDFQGSKTKRKSHVRLQVTKANYSAPIPGRWLRRDQNGVLRADETIASSKPTLVPTGKLEGTRSA